MASSCSAIEIHRILNLNWDISAKVKQLETLRLRCDICQKDFNRLYMVGYHILSRKHTKKLANQNQRVFAKIVGTHLNRLLAQDRNDERQKKRLMAQGPPYYTDPRVEALKRRFQSLKEENYKLKAMLSTYLEEAEESKATIKLRKEYEKCRAAAIALKDVGGNLPSAKLDDIEWAKDISVHFTQRSKKVNEYRLNILKYPKYAALGKGEYLIENNLLNDEEVGHYQFAEDTLNVMKEFVIKNEGAGNVSPDVLVNRRWMKYESLDNVLGFRIIDPSNCVHLPNPKILEGQKECYAKLNIPNGTILRQYVGNEMTQSEYHKIYNGTKEEMHHLSFMHGDTLLLPDGERLDIYIDGIGVGDTSPLLYINDGRANIREKETPGDAKRMNVEFIGVLCNGWPMILVRSTKPIKSGDSLWINYGPRFGLVLDEHDLVKQQRDRMQESFDNILSGVNLNENRGLEIFSDSEDDDDITLKPMKNRAAMDDNDIFADDLVRRSRKLKYYESLILQHEPTKSKFECNFKLEVNLWNEDQQGKSQNNYWRTKGYTGKDCGGYEGKFDLNLGAQKVSNILGVRKIIGDRKYHGIRAHDILWSNKMEGQMECFAKQEIAPGTIIGPYMGREMLKEEFETMYENKRERMEHLRYVFTDAVLLPNKQLIEIYIDGLAGDKTYPLLYINDCRMNIRKVKKTDIDREKINCEFLLYVLHGLPAVFIKSTKTIFKEQPLFIDYGIRFGTVLEPKLQLMDMATYWRQSAISKKNKVENHDNKDKQMDPDMLILQQLDSEFMLQNNRNR